jgi:hypothetical protein
MRTLQLLIAVPIYGLNSKKHGKCECEPIEGNIAAVAIARAVLLEPFP